MFFSKPMTVSKNLKTIIEELFVKWYAEERLTVDLLNTILANFPQTTIDEYRFLEGIIYGVQEQD